MYCMNCKHSKFERSNDDGEIDLFCFKFDKFISAKGKCIKGKKFAQDERAKKIYLENYQTKPTSEIARMIGWSMNKLHYFVDSQFLPKLQRSIRRKKGEKKYVKKTEEQTG